MFKELEVVELTHDIKENKLKEGDRGTIVEVYKGGEAYEVEFISTDGKTSVLRTLLPEDIRPILNKEIYFSSEFDNPIYLYRDTESGIAAVDLTSKDLLKGIYPFKLEIKTEIRKNEAAEKAFYYQSTTI